jgi:hypothetical protein
MVAERWCDGGANLHVTRALDRERELEIGGRRCGVAERRLPRVTTGV